MGMNIGTRRALLSNPSSAIKYLLYDTFATALAAGAVNGTASEPGSNALANAAPVRTVVDTHTYLSVAAGQLTFTNVASGAYGDPGLWYSSQARTLGKALLFQFRVSSIAANGLEMGWGTGQSGEVKNNSLYLSGAALFAYNNATFTNLGTTLSAATTYQGAVVLRASGAWFFIKGGAFTNWTLLYVSVAPNTASVFPGVIMQAAITGLLDIFRIPQPLYIPSPLAYDAFTRANGALGSTETTGPDAQAIAALAWTVQDGTIVVASNQASDTVLGGDSQGFATVSTSSADVIIDVAVTRTAGSAGIVARWQSSTDYLIAYVDGTNCKCDKVVAGVTTNLRSAAVTYGAGNVLRLVLSGTTGWLFYNNAAVGASFTVPSSSYTLHGLYDNDLSALWDNFTVWPRGTSNEFAQLDAY